MFLLDVRGFHSYAEPASDLAAAAAAAVADDDDDVLQQLVDHVDSGSMSFHLYSATADHDLVRRSRRSPSKTADHLAPDEGQGYVCGLRHRQRRLLACTTADRKPIRRRRDSTSWRCVSWTASLAVNGARRHANRRRATVLDEFQLTAETAPQRCRNPSMPAANATHHNY